MAKKGYWQTKKGKSAIQQQGAIDAAGAMRVTPVDASPRAVVDMRAFGATTGSRPPSAGVNPASLPGRGTMASYSNKLISQGPSTGFGSFRGGGTRSTTTGAMRSPSEDINMLGPIWNEV